MTLDKMSAQPSAHLECPLEVDAIAGLLVSQVGSVERFGAGLDLEGLGRGRRRRSGSNR